MSFNRRGFHSNFETTPTLFIAEVYYGARLLAIVYRAQLPGVEDAVLQDVQNIVNDSYNDRFGNISWPPLMSAHRGSRRNVRKSTNVHETK